MWGTSFISLIKKFAVLVLRCLLWFDTNSISWFYLLPELCINSLSQTSTKLQNHSPWKRCSTSQHSEWYDVGRGGDIQTCGCESSWGNSKRFKCMLLVRFSIWFSIAFCLPFSITGFFLLFNKQKVAVVTIGFVKDARAHIDVQGFNVYHKNRLIKVIFLVLLYIIYSIGIFQWLKLSSMVERLKPSFMVQWHCA